MKSPRTETAYWFAVALVWIVSYVLQCEFVFGADIEELRSGMLAAGILDGVSYDPWIYQYQPWAHGPIVYGFLLLPLYALVGPSAAAFKIVGGLFAFGGCAVWTIAVRRQWGIRPAMLLGLWWLLPPPFLEQSWHRAWANHMESVFFMGLLFLAAFHKNLTTTSAQYRFVVGFLGGFACFFCLQNVLAAVVIGALIGFDAARQRNTALLIPVAFGVALGVAPHYASPYEWNAIVPGTPPISNIVLDLGDLLGTALPVFAGYRPAGGSVVFFFAGVLGLAWMLFDAKRKISAMRWMSATKWPLQFYASGFFLAFTVAYVISGFKMSFPLAEYWHRYLVTLFPVLMIGVIWLAERRLWAGLALFGAILLASIPVKVDRFATMKKNIAARGVTTSLCRQRGDDTLFFATHNLPSTFREDVEIAAMAFDQLPPPWRPLAMQALGARRNFDEADLAVADLPDLRGEQLAALVRGWGASWSKPRQRADPLWPARTRGAIQSLRAHDEALGKAFARGIGFGLGGSDCEGSRQESIRSALQVFEDRTDSVSEFYGEVSFGMGERCGIADDRQSKRDSREFALPSEGIADNRPARWFDGFWAGRALLFMNNYNSVVVDWQDTDEWRHLRRAIVEAGGSVTPDARDLRVFRISARP